jgi:crotonobetainyl-CoA:carnitine CoA-transferase CaiB-like acyl-CoA transferase
MKALEGIRVLDLTHAHAGPICTYYMAAMGAEVIKVEPPWGEMNRFFPPLPRGKEMFKEMVKKADVVMENFSPGTIDDLGLGYETLRELNPNIIFASISGFGQTGPWRNRRSFDSVAQAASGYMWVTGESVDPEGPPMKGAEAIADTVPGLTALVGILAALNHRNRTGRGQRIDVAQMDSMIAVMQSFSFWELARTTFGVALDDRVDRSFGIHKARDGYVMFMAPAGRLTDWFRELLGVEELERGIVEEWVAERTVDEVVETLAETGIPVAPVLSLGEVMENEQALHREMFVRVDHPTLGETILPGFPIKFSETNGDVTRPAPLLGQYNNEVYSGLLGFSEDEIEALRKEGVI